MTFCIFQVSKKMQNNSVMSQSPIVFIFLDVSLFTGRAFAFFCHYEHLKPHIICQKYIHMLHIYIVKENKAQTKAEVFICMEDAGQCPVC